MPEKTKEKSFERVVLSTNLTVDREQSTDKYLELQLVLPDQSAHTVLAIFPDQYYVNFQELNRGKFPFKVNNILNNMDFIKYLVKVFNELDKTLHEVVDWYGFLTFSFSYEDFISGASMSERIHDAKARIDKERYLVRYRLTSALGGDWKDIDYVISSNLALDVEYHDLHPLLYVFNILNPNLGLELVKRKNEVDYHSMYKLKNLLTGVTVMVRDVKKRDFSMDEDMPHIVASYFHHPFCPKITKLNTIAASKCVL